MFFGCPEEIRIAEWVRVAIYETLKGKMMKIVEITITISENDGPNGLTEAECDDIIDKIEYVDWADLARQRLSESVAKRVIVSSNI